MKLTLKEFIKPYQKTDYEHLNLNISFSEHGYWITPEGTVYSLEEAMSHGAVAAAIIPEMFNKYIEETNDPTNRRSIGTNLDIRAVYDYKWFRVSITPGLGDLNFSWGDKVTNKQLKAMEIIIDTHDPDHEMEYWYDGGPGTLRQLREKIRETAHVLTG